MSVSGKALPPEGDSIHQPGPQQVWEAQECCPSRVSGEQVATYLLSLPLPASACAPVKILHNQLARKKTWETGSVWSADPSWEWDAEVAQPHQSSPEADGKCPLGLCCSSASCLSPEWFMVRGY